MRQSSPSTMHATVLRPCHVYGPGSLLGCLPMHGRNPQLLDKLQRGEPLILLGGGFFLQQPVFAEDLWRMAMSCLGTTVPTAKSISHPGRNIVDRARVLSHRCRPDRPAGVTIGEIAVKDYLQEHPEQKSFCAHRVYATVKAKNHQLQVPATSLTEGLNRHVESLRSA